MTTILLTLLIGILLGFTAGFIYTVRRFPGIVAGFTASELRQFTEKVRARRS